MKIEELYKYYKESYSVVTDTRKIKKGDLFFALKGSNFDGNTFAYKAIELGASYAVIDNKKYQSKQTILVENVLKSLQELAKYHRKQLNIPILSITGSNGKTTTKELVNAVLSKKYKVVATKGNLNNHIGVPLTLLSMLPDTELGIVEMGANHLKEIAFLCNIAQPNYGYITNFGKAHLEGFGGVEGVIKGKTELYDYLKNTNGACFANNEDPIQLEKSKDLKRHLLIDNTKLIQTQPQIIFRYEGLDFKSHLTGEYNYQNIKVALTIGKFFDVPLDKIKEAIEAYIPSNNRSQELYKETTRIVLDAYNANPTSMEKSLRNFSKLSEQRKIVFLGDMFELGKYSKEEHQKVYNIAQQLNFSAIYLIGNHFSKVKTNSNTTKYKDFKALKDVFDTIDLKNSVILIKGSRGMALEQILDLL